MNLKKQIEIASKQTKYSNVKKGRVAAIALSQSGRLICCAHNSKACGTKRKWSVHAEDALIRKLVKLNAFKRFGRINILVLRTTKQGISMAKPCCACQKLLNRYPVNIFYTNWKGIVTNG